MLQKKGKKTNTKAHQELSTRRVKKGKKMKVQSSDACPLGDVNIEESARTHNQKRKRKPP